MSKESINEAALRELNSGSFRSGSGLTIVEFKTPQPSTKKKENEKAQARAPELADINSGSPRN